MTDPTQIWDHLCERYVTASRQLRDGDRAARERATAATRDAFQLINSQRTTPAVVDWSSATLGDHEKKWFVAQTLMRAASLPKKLLTPLVRAAVYEPNPSSNAEFLEPCVRSFPAEQVYEELFEYLVDGNGLEKTGAVSALYHVPFMASRLHGVPLDSERKAIELTIKAFLQCEFVSLRQGAIGYLTSKGEKSLQPFAEEFAAVLAIARDSEDSYIRHRAALHDGEEPLLRAIPPRTECSET